MSGGMSSASEDWVLEWWFWEGEIRPSSVESWRGDSVSLLVERWGKKGKGCLGSSVSLGV